MRFKCNKKDNCKFCAECCRFREDITLDSKEENNIKKALFSKTGVLYLFPFNRYTINITSGEKDILENEAKKNNLKIHILPKKIFISDGGIIIYDYFIDADVCPFLNSDNKCSIYENRPFICKQFPHIDYDNNDFLQFKKNNLIITQDFEKCLDYVKKNLKLE